MLKTAVESPYLCSFAKRMENRCARSNFGSSSGDSLLFGSNANDFGQQSDQEGRSDYFGSSFGNSRAFGSNASNFGQQFDQEDRARSNFGSSFGNSRAFGSNANDFEQQSGQEKDDSAAIAMSRLTIVEPKIPSFARVNDSHFVFEPVRFFKCHREFNYREAKKIKGKLEVKHNLNRSDPSLSKADIKFTPKDKCDEAYEFSIPFSHQQVFVMTSSLHTVMMVGYNERTISAIDFYIYSAPSPQAFQGQEDVQVFSKLCRGINI